MAAAVIERLREIARHRHVACACDLVIVERMLSVVVPGVSDPLPSGVPLSLLVVLPSDLVAPSWLVASAPPSCDWAMSSSPLSLGPVASELELHAAPEKAAKIGKIKMYFARTRIFCLLAYVGRLRLAPRHEQSRGETSATRGTTVNAPRA